MCVKSKKCECVHNEMVIILLYTVVIDDVYATYICCMYIYGVCVCVYVFVYLV